MNRKRIQPTIVTEAVETAVAFQTTNELRPIEIDQIDFMTLVRVHKDKAKELTFSDDDDDSESYTDDDDEPIDPKEANMTFKELAQQNQTYIIRIPFHEESVELTESDEVYQQRRRLWLDKDIIYRMTLIESAFQKQKWQSLNTEYKSLEEYLFGLNKDTSAYFNNDFYKRWKFEPITALSFQRYFGLNAPYYKTNPMTINQAASTLVNLVNKTTEQDVDDAMKALFSNAEPVDMLPSVSSAPVLQRLCDKFHNQYKMIFECVRDVATLSEYISSATGDYNLITDEIINVITKLHRIEKQCKKLYPSELFDDIEAGSMMKIYPFLDNVNIEDVIDNQNAIFQLMYVGMMYYYHMARDRDEAADIADVVFQAIHTLIRYFSNGDLLSPYKIHYESLHLDTEGRKRLKTWSQFTTKHKALLDIADDDDEQAWSDAVDDEDEFTEDSEYTEEDRDVDMDVDLSDEEEYSHSYNTYNPGSTDKEQIRRYNNFQALEYVKQGRRRYDV
jgi:hypothetical protein